MDWKNLNARPPSGDLYEVERLSTAVWAIRLNGVVLPGWASSKEEAIEDAERHHRQVSAKQHRHHFGDPCVHCGTPHNAVPIGSCLPA